jgi:hypothetical protein
LVAKFGILGQIHTDGGKKFINKLSVELFQLLNVRDTKNSPAHPQCNAQVEVFNKTVKKFLQSFVDDTTLNWENFCQHWPLAITLAITLQLQPLHLNYYLGKKCDCLLFQMRTFNKFTTAKLHQQKDLIYCKNCDQQRIYSQQNKV